LLKLLQADAMPEAVVVRQLKAFVRATRRVPERLGRTYLISKGTDFQLTAVFEKPAWNLYQVTLRLTPAAYEQVRAHALALAAATPEATWQNAWLGLLPKLVVRLPGASPRPVTARFTGLLPNLKVVVLTRT
jgi:hypothetical protein